ncbi:hypothetical protein FOB58_005678 [Candida parapsilosis]|uniref:Uncharacterized protein n=2 Tax=Candida parapsilosis TaxID=5480 RepID=G8BKG5_CANPC|nr:uncharacterized protein CPAR2_702430 [Candida parapsilosis]KAF6042195.1 hypothetical protein FOB58_005678 [Candida parapsilosis]KAF6042474.1 hypothetical protein FOB59_005656 [Candida parapsilosis]KAF6042919.1 hypothetical protein FOB60_005673 [Candida parapsilosis]KAF6058072.1 hypothetical protein FOB61_005661 [Candida parapsilosis]KAI5905053.1 Uncharacterized protein K4G60_g4311 [Candida parapsilosis]
MTTLQKKTDPHQLHDAAKPLNLTNPVRLAFLGGSKSGKTSIISKLILGNFNDTYYPTTYLNPNLFNYEPSSERAKDILRGKPLTSNSHLTLPPSIRNSNVPTTGKNIFSKNQYYSTSLSVITPILVELIDTPGYNPDKTVPYLEASLYTNLDRDVLHNLANEPRRPVSTSPLLVASGASELNGDVNGYFFVYSAIPSFAPPKYNDDQSGGGELPKNHTFNLLPSIKAALNDAWEEYISFKENWKKGQEDDVFSFKSALKSFWKTTNDATTNASAGQQATTTTATARSPPIWIICTHVNSDLASDQLVLEGRKLSQEWDCGFIALDCLDDIDEVLSLMIRDIIQGKKR